MISKDKNGHDLGDIESSTPAPRPELATKANHMGRPSLSAFNVACDENREKQKKETKDGE